MPVAAQNSLDTLRLGEDSLQQRLDSFSIKKFSADSVRKYFQSSDSTVSLQLQKVEQYSEQLGLALSRLKRGYNTAALDVQLPQSDSILRIAEYVLDRHALPTSIKILYNTRDNLQVQQKRLEEWQDQLGKQSKALNEYQDLVTKIRRDQILLKMPTDSLLFSAYIEKLRPLGKKLKLTDSLTNVQLTKLGLLQNKVSSDFLSVSDFLYEVGYQIEMEGATLFQDKYGPIWQPTMPRLGRQHFNNVVGISLLQSRTMLGFYLQSHWPSRFVILLLGIGFWWLMFWCMKRIKATSDRPAAILGKTAHIYKHSWASSTLFTLVLIPILYPTAPQAFTQIVLFIQVLALGVLLRQKLNISGGLQTLAALILFYIISFTNLLVEITYPERVLHLLLSAVSMTIGIWYLKGRKRSYFSKVKFFVPLLYLFIFLTGAAIIANIMGRVPLAKELNAAAIFGLVEALILFVFVEIIVDALILLMEAGKKSSRIAAYIKFKGAERSMRKVLGFLATMIWVIAFSQNVHIYDTIFGTFKDFLYAKQSIVNLNFTFMGVLVFFVIIYIANLLSQMVAFIFGDDTSTALSPSKGHKLGSTVLLIRLAIFLIGILIAFGASGIPLDKLALILGALGVGIGFGLQNIVNNLVSGVILAFEKPVQIGDLIEVAGQVGRVKEVGIRSSKLITYDGSEIIIPNGDLISNHLINWTLQNKERRVGIPVGVAYGTDVDQVTELILAMLAQNTKIVQFPGSSVMVENMGDNSVELEVFFWCKVEDWIQLKSDVLGDIYRLLNLHNVDFPFPQRDLHIKSIHPDVADKFRSKD